MLEFSGLFLGITPLRPADRVPLELPFDVKLGGLPEFGGFEVTEWIDEGPWDEAGDPLLALLTRGIPEKNSKLNLSLLFQKFT